MSQILKRSDDNLVGQAPLAEVGGGRTDPYKDRPRRQWWLVFCLLLMFTLGTIDRQIISLLINPMKADLGLTDTQISLVYGAAFAIAYVAFTLPAGYLADRTTRRWLIAAGAAVWSIMTMLCGVAGNFVQLLLVRAGVGFGEGVIHPVSYSMLRSALSPDRRGRGFAVFAMGGMIGSALALLAGGAIIAAVDHSGLDHIPIFGRVSSWQIVLILLGLISLPLPLLMLTVREPARPAGAASGAAVTFSEALAYVRLHRRVFAPVFAFQILYSMSALAFGAWIVPMMGRTYGLSIPTIGLTLGVMMLVLPPAGTFASGIAVDWINKRSGLKGVSLLGVAVMLAVTIMMIVMPLMPSVPALWFAMALLMPISGAPHPIGLTLVATVTPANLMGKISSFQVFLNGILAAAVGPTVVAAVADGFFQGPQALGYALSLVTGGYGILATAAILAAFFALRSYTPPEEGLS